MNELITVKGTELSINSIQSLSEADDILVSLNETDNKILEVVIHNAIARGQVYHRITSMTKENDEYYTHEDIAERYKISKGSVYNYMQVSENAEYILSYNLDNPQHDGETLKPSLTSILDYIKRSPEKVALRIDANINNRVIVNKDIKEVVEDYLEDASEDIRYLFSSKSRVSLGKLSTAIRGGSEKEILEIMRLGGRAKNKTGNSKTFKETIRELEEENEDLRCSNEILKNRMDFLLKTISANSITQLLRRISNQAGALRKFKYDPELIKAFDILGVGADVTLSELKKAYYAKVKDAHPDVGGNEEMFKKIVEANDRLKKAIKEL